MSRLIRSPNKNSKPAPQDGPPAQDDKQLNDSPKSDIAPNAEVWKKYVEETDRYDKELVDGWNNSLDMLLIFAALFSAISTAFVLESTQDLKPDYAETSAQTLASILEAISSGNSANGSNIPTTDQPVFTPSSAAVTVNILWFMSLSLSVAVALIAIVAKDWCYQFMAGRNGAFLTQGRRRQLRWEGIEQWKMQEILNVLPLMMHAALLLFASGLILFLWDINPRVALPVLVTTIIVGVFYFVTLFLPLFYRYCPFTIGLVKLFLPYWYKIPRSTFESTLQALGTIFVPPIVTISLIGRIIRRDPAHSQNPELKPGRAGFRRWIPRVPFVGCWNESKQRMKDRMTRIVERFMTDKSQLVGQEAPMDYVTSSMLGWMITECGNPNSAAAAYRALVCTKAWLPRKPLVKSGALVATVARTGAHMIAWHDARRADDEESRKDLTKKLLLLSQSLSIMSHIESLELPEGYLTAIFEVYPALDHAWYLRDGLGSGMAVKELGSLSLHLSDHWERHLDYREQLDRQKVLLEQITTGKIVGLSPEEICYVVDGIAKSYLYQPDQSPDLPIKLINMSKYESHIPLRRMVGVALTIACIANYERPGHDPAPNQSNRLKRARKLYIQLTTMRSEDNLYEQDLDCKQLLLFGLVGFLLAEPNAKWSLNIQSLVNAISKVGLQFYTTSDHPILGLSEHPAETMVKWLLEFGYTGSRTGSRDPPRADTPPEGGDVAIEVSTDSPSGHSGAGDNGHDSKMTWERLNEPAYLERAKYVLRLLRGSAVPDRRWRRGYFTTPAFDKIIETKFHEQVHKLTSSIYGDIIPHCMSFLWVFTRSILVVHRKPRWSHQIDASAILNPLRTHQENAPKEMTDMGFTETWIDKLKAACERNPQNLLESGILDKMIKYYKGDTGYYYTTDTDDADDADDIQAAQPNSTDAHDSEGPITLLEFLQRLARSCRERAQASGSEPRSDSGTDAVTEEESQMEEADDEDLDQGEDPSVRGDEPMGDIQTAVESGRLPPEVLEYVPWQYQIIQNHRPSTNMPGIYEHRS